MADAVEDIINQALRAGSVPMRVEEMYEGSDASRVALELYGQSRDELLDLRDWSFSRRVTPLTLLKGPPPPGGYTPASPWSNIYPYPGFLYEYAYPADCLDVRAILPGPGAMPDLDPVPALWRVDNDATPNVSGTPPVASGPAAKVIYANATNAIVVYRAQITNPASFDTGFIAALVAALGKKFAKAFGVDINAVKEDTAESVGTAELASSLRG